MKETWTCIRGIEKRSRRAKSGYRYNTEPHSSVSITVRSKQPHKLLFLNRLVRLGVLRGAAQGGSGGARRLAVEALEERLAVASGATGAEFSPALFAIPVVVVQGVGELRVGGVGDGRVGGEGRAGGAP